MQPQHKLRSRSGFTMIEMVIVVAVMGMVLGAVGMFQKRGNEHTQALIERSEVEARARRGLEKVVSELTGVGQSLLVPDPISPMGTATLSYQHPLGINGAGVVNWGPSSRLQLELEPGEADNGSDDDGDGLIDEQRLVLIREVGTANESSVVLCRGIAELGTSETANGSDDDGDGVVDEAGFNIQRIGDLLTVRLCVLEARRNAQPIVVELESSIVLRN